MVKVLFNKEDIIATKLYELNISSAIYKSKNKWKQKAHYKFKETLEKY